MYHLSAHNSRQNSHCICVATNFCDPDFLVLRGTVSNLTRDQSLVFIPDWDQMPPNELKFWPYKTGYTRTKLAHAQGAVAMVEWVSNGSHNYTGLFQGVRAYPEITTTAQVKLQLDSLRPLAV
jgi:hypothetical protein